VLDGRASRQPSDATEANGTNASGLTRFRRRILGRRTKKAIDAAFERRERGEIEGRAVLGPGTRRDARVRVEAVRGDITDEHVDVIVNAANSSLRRGAGVCGAIFAAAGPELDVACAAIGGCATGDAVITPGFALTARWIIHTVGPIWAGGDRGEPAMLAACYRRSIELARAVGAISIAFPAISTGIYGYPRRAAAEIAVTTTLATATDQAQFEVIRFVAFDAATLHTYEELLDTSR